MSTTTDRTDATDAEFAARIAAYPADVAYAAMVERVAEALWVKAQATVHMTVDLGPESTKDDREQVRRERYRILAAAAVAALPAHPAVEAVKRVEAVADELDEYVAHAQREAEEWAPDQHLVTSWEGKASAYHWSAQLVRAVLAPQAGDGAR